MSIKNTLFISFLYLVVTGCANNQSLQLVASSVNQWTGVAISKKQNRIFVNFPQWSEKHTISVAEIKESGEIIPFPNAVWNMGNEHLQHFVCVQSVFVDEEDNLWILETSNPMFRGVIGAPILYKASLATDTIVRRYVFESSVFYKDSYFNDVRIDEERQLAYITDSGVGGIVVLDLQTGKARRFLESNHSVKAETDRLVIGGIVWENEVHSDGITLSKDKDYLYYIPLTGHTLYRVPAKVLCLNNTEAIDDFVEVVGKVGATDGMFTTQNGDIILGGLETNSINLLKNGTTHKVVSSSKIRWADSFAEDSEGFLYFTTSQIHIPEKDRELYRVYRFKPCI